MNELAQALRDFADRIERGDIIPGASQCAIVLSDDAGTLSSTYIGRYVPAHRAGINLLAAGIVKFNEAQLKAETTNAPNATHRGSTH